MVLGQEEKEKLTPVDWVGVFLACGSWAEKARALFRWERMMARLLEINTTFFAPDRGQKDPAACATAAGKYGGWWGPWVDDVALDLATIK